MPGRCGRRASKKSSLEGGWKENSEPQSLWIDLEDLKRTSFDCTYRQKKPRRQETGSRTLGRLTQ